MSIPLRVKVRTALRASSRLARLLYLIQSRLGTNAPGTGMVGSWVTHPSGGARLYLFDSMACS